MIEANTNLEIDDEQEWEEILFGTLEEGVMGQLALGTVLAILAGKALESTGVLSNFPVGSAQRYELIAAYGASVGLASRYILGLAGEKLARRARRQAASLSNEIQETIAEGLVSDPKFVSLLDNLRDLSEKVVEIKGKRGKQFQAIRAAKKKAAADLKSYIANEGLNKIPPELAKRARGMPVDAKRAGMRAKRKYYGELEESKMAYTVGELKRLIEELPDDLTVKLSNKNTKQEYSIWETWPGGGQLNITMVEKKMGMKENYIEKIIKQEIKNYEPKENKKVSSLKVENSLIKTRKDNLKAMIKEEINSYMDEVISNGNIGLEEAPVHSELDMATDEETLMKLLSAEIGQVPDNKKKNLLSTLLNAVNNYVARQMKENKQLSEEQINEFVNNLLAENTELVQEGTKDVLKDAIKQALAAAGLIAALGGAGDAKAAEVADMAAAQFAKAQQSQGAQAQAYDPGNKKSFQFGGEKDPMQQSSGKTNRQGPSNVEETPNAYLVTVDEQNPNKMDLVANALKRSGVPFDDVTLQKYLVKKGGEIDQSGQFRTFSLPKAK
tara:strand:- start:15710 stop:17374 length:1665 start_codon:yes stop_codon:yes gene_type:complete